VGSPGQHQLNSRVFMDMSRIAAEDYFISMLPKKYRTPLRLNWNKPAPKSKKNNKFKLYEYFFGTTTEKIKFKFSQDWGKGYVCF